MLLEDVGDFIRLNKDQITIIVDGKEVAAVDNVIYCIAKKG